MESMRQFWLSRCVTIPYFEGVEIDHNIGMNSFGDDVG
jgi:hypothetical protein